jgi:hypothetical protein
VDGQFWPSGADPPEGTALLEATLHPGDALYFPRGTLHHAATGDEPSLHLTLGLTTTSWWDLLRLLPEALRGDPELRADVPHAARREPACLDGPARTTATRVAAWLLDVGPEALAALAVDRFAREHGPAPCRHEPFRREALLAGLRPERVVELRPGAYAVVRHDGGGPVLVHGRDEGSLDADEGAVLGVLGDRRPHRLHELLGDGGERRLAAVRRVADRGLLDPA